MKQKNLCHLFFLNGIVAISAIDDKSKLGGMTIQQMLNRFDLHKIIIGIKTNQALGPMIIFEHGKIFIESIKDITTAMTSVIRYKI